MKKIFAVLVLLTICVLGAFAQDYIVERTVKNMTLPDGAVADVLFFKKWSDAGKYVKEMQPKDKDSMVGTTVAKAKTESELGYFRKTYKADENDSVAAICAVHKETGSKYSVAWVDHGDRVTRCMFTYKSGKLTYDRTDFFDESNETYAEFMAKENAKQEKVNKIAKDVTNSIFEVFLPSQKELTPEEFKTELYNARHQPHEMFDSFGNIIVVYLIFSDDGYSYSLENPHLVVDKNGRFRKYDYSHCDLIPTPDVSKEVQEAAKKSLYK